MVIIDNFLAFSSAACITKGLEMLEPTILQISGYLAWPTGVVKIFEC